MYSEQSELVSTSRSKVEHKFFEKTLDNDLKSLSNFLHTQYDKIVSGELLKNKESQQTLWDKSGSASTINWNKYNLFQFYHPAIHKLYNAVRDMTKEACDYYGTPFEKEQFWTQAWFNINHNHVGKLDWHEHGGPGAPWFHGYYSVNAEPSVTHYRIFDKEFDNHNKNNRAILSETGHPHAMADWDWEGPRITIAYDVVPFRGIMQEWEQHWIPLC
jgi:hypothetical protein